MLLIIHNLPSHTRFPDVKALIKEKCGLTEVVLDNLVPENEGGKKISVGLADEVEAALLVRKINGLYVGGQQLYVEDIKNKQPADQPYYSSQSFRPVPHPFENDGSNSNNRMIGNVIPMSMPSSTSMFDMQQNSFTGFNRPQFPNTVKPQQQPPQNSYQYQNSQSSNQGNQIWEPNYNNIYFDNKPAKNTSNSGPSKWNQNSHSGSKRALSPARNSRSSNREPPAKRSTGSQSSKYVEQRMRQFDAYGREIREQQQFKQKAEKVPLMSIQFESAPKEYERSRPRVHYASYNLKVDHRVHTSYNLKIDNRDRNRAQQQSKNEPPKSQNDVRYIPKPPDHTQRQIPDKGPSIRAGHDSRVRPFRDNEPQYQRSAPRSGDRPYKQFKASANQYLQENFEEPRFDTNFSSDDVWNPQNSSTRNRYMNEYQREPKTKKDKFLRPKKNPNKKVYYSPSQKLLKNTFENHYKTSNIKKPSIAEVFNKDQKFKNEACNIIFKELIYNRHFSYSKTEQNEFNLKLKKIIMSRIEILLWEKVSVPPQQIVKEYYRQHEKRSNDAFIETVKSSFENEQEERKKAIQENGAQQVESSVAASEDAPDSKPDIQNENNSEQSTQASTQGIKVDPSETFSPQQPFWQTLAEKAIKKKEARSASESQLKIPPIMQKALDIELKALGEKVEQAMMFNGRKHVKQMMLNEYKPKLLKEIEVTTKKRLLDVPTKNLCIRVVGAPRLAPKAALIRFLEENNMAGEAEINRNSFNKKNRNSVTLFCKRYSVFDWLLALGHADIEGYTVNFSPIYMANEKIIWSESEVKEHRKKFILSQLDSFVGQNQDHSDNKKPYDQWINDVEEVDPTNEDEDDDEPDSKTQIQNDIKLSNSDDDNFDTSENEREVKNANTDVKTETINENTDASTTEDLKGDILSNEEAFLSDNVKSETVTEDCKNDVTVAEDSKNDVTVAVNSKNDVTIAEDNKNDVTVAEDNKNDVTVAEDIKNVYEVSVDPKIEEVATNVTLEDISKIASTIDDINEDDLEDY